MAKAKKKAARKKKSTSKKSIAKKATSKKKTAKKSAKPGLYANIHKAQERQAHGGRKVRKKGQKGAPSQKAFRESAKTAKK